MSTASPKFVISAFVREDGAAKWLYDPRIVVLTPRSEQELRVAHFCSRSNPRVAGDLEKRMGELMLTSS